MKSFKILHVIAGMDPQMGGVCQAVRLMISGLAKFDISNEVVSLDPVEATYLVNDPFPVHAVGNGIGPWGYNKQLLGWLKKNLKQFDVVVLHGLWLYPGYALRKALQSVKKDGEDAPKFFVMPHGMLDPYFQLAPGRKLKAIRNNIFWTFIEKKIVRDADGLLFTCEMEKLLARKPFSGYKPKKELVVGLGIEEAPLYTLSMNEAFIKKLSDIDLGTYLLYISRIHEKKGIDLLINAYSNLKKTYSNIPSLVIAGPGLDTPYGNYIQELAAKSSDIYFTGMLSGDTKWGAFYGCEAFILPSHQENFGIAVVEAMSCEKPVLITSQVNIWKEIIEAQGGLVAEDTLDGIQEQLKRWILLSNDEKKMMGQHAKRCFENTFAVSSITIRLQKAITDAH